MADEQHLVYRAGDWNEIAADLPRGDPFSYYLNHKSYAVTRSEGAGHPFGETVTDIQAGNIREAAQRRGFQEIDGHPG